MLMKEQTDLFYTYKFVLWINVINEQENNKIEEHNMSLNMLNASTKI